MAATTVRGAQVRDGTVQRADLDIATVGQAVIRKLVQGTGVTLSSTGADAGTGDVTVNATASGFNPAVDAAFTAPQTITVDDAQTAVDTTVLSLIKRSTGTPVAGFGPTLWLRGDSATVTDQSMAQIFAAWSDAIDATRKSYLGFRVAAGALAEKMRLHSSGGLSVNNLADPGAGVIDANSGFRTGGAAPAVNKILKSDGVKFAPSAEIYAAPGAAGGNFRSDGTDWARVVYASLQATGPNPTAITGNVEKMYGLGSTFKITPTASGKVLISIFGTGWFTTNGTSGTWQLRYGQSASAPANNAAATGTASGVTSGANSLGIFQSMTFTILLNLTVGLPYWFDIGASTNNAAGLANMSTILCSIVELP